MSKYAVTFTKEGYVKYTSHLDMLRLFKRAVKKAGIKLQYSQGYNPHPKLGFAQPLSLGYESLCEALEIETVAEMNPEDIKNGLQKSMPDGIKIVKCVLLPESVKSVAALVEEADYIVQFPLDKDSMDFQKIITEYLGQSEILALKRQKKTKKMVEVNIKSKIRNIELMDLPILTFKLKVDCGSNSNLSPEQVIASFIEFAKLPCERYGVEVKRLKIKYGKNLQI